VQRGGGHLDVNEAVAWNSLRPEQDQVAEQQPAPPAGQRLVDPPADNSTANDPHNRTPVIAGSSRTLHTSTHWR
jgi:hypothetical protein